MDPIPSIAEQDAPEAIARLYDDIMRTLGVPTTNLIWRHLATIDNALPVVWRILKPYYLSSELSAAAAEVRDIGNLPNFPMLSETQLLSSGINANERAIVCAVLQNYDRTNPANLVAFCALLARLDGRELSGELPQHRAPAKPAIGVRLPLLISESEMTIEVQTDVYRLNALGLDPPPHSLIAAVPRHLANWPCLLNAMVDELAHYETPIAQAIDSVQHTADQLGRLVAARIDARVHDVDWDIVAASLRRFTSRELIANYIVKVRLMLSLIGAVESD